MHFMINLLWLVEHSDLFDKADGKTILQHNTMVEPPGVVLLETNRMITEVIDAVVC